MLTLKTQRQMCHCLGTGACMGMSFTQTALETNFSNIDSKQLKGAQHDLTEGTYS